MESAQQQLPTVPADTTGLLSELERLADKVRVEGSAPQDCREPELVIRGK